MRADIDRCWMDVTCGYKCTCNNYFNSKQQPVTANNKPRGLQRKTDAKTGTQHTTTRRSGLCPQVVQTLRCHPRIIIFSCWLLRVSTATTIATIATAAVLYAASEPSISNSKGAVAQRTETIDQYTPGRYKQELLQCGCYSTEEKSYRSGYSAAHILPRIYVNRLAPSPPPPPPASYRHPPKE